MLDDHTPKTDDFSKENDELRAALHDVNIQLIEFKHAFIDMETRLEAMTAELDNMKAAQ